MIHSFVSPLAILRAMIRNSRLVRGAQHGR